ncbi:Uncharacterised protein [Staphylococcus aureus]|nr:Uncharacterised protein [Staphylococcus aureus]
MLNDLQLALHLLRQIHAKLRLNYFDVDVNLLNIFYLGHPCFKLPLCKISQYDYDNKINQPSQLIIILPTN